MNLRQRFIFNRWMRRVRSTLPVAFGVAIGAAAFAVFDQTYGSSELAQAAETAQQESTEPFPNCNAARAEHAAPLHRGEPGYAPHLDADGDGVACEPYPR